MSSTDAVTVNDDQNRKTRAEVKEEENKSIEEPNNIVVEKTSNGDNLVEANNKRHE